MHLFSRSPSSSSSVSSRPGEIVSESRTNFCRLSELAKEQLMQSSSSQRSSFWGQISTTICYFKCTKKLNRFINVNNQPLAVICPQFCITTDCLKMIICQQQPQINGLRSLALWRIEFAPFTPLGSCLTKVFFSLIQSQTIHSENPIQNSLAF